MEKEVSLVPVPFPSAPSLPPNQSFGQEDEGDFGFHWKKAKIHYFQKVTTKLRTNPTGYKKNNVRPKAEAYSPQYIAPLSKPLCYTKFAGSKQHDTLLL